MRRFFSQNRIFSYKKSPVLGPGIFALCFIIDFSESGKRGSNSRPSAWEADALPTELLPHQRHKGNKFFLNAIKKINVGGCDCEYHAREHEHRYACECHIQNCQS